MSQNQLTTTEPKGVMAAMAERFEMDPVRFEQTIRKTVMPSKVVVSNEQLAGFLLIAKEYNLNPLTKEIYAFPSNGGIQPIVSIDGWVNLINSHPKMDGIELEEQRDDNGEVYAVKCSIYRKDRSRPAIVTEYMDECVRQTEPWRKWPIRMLRHKALIQCARVAFGYAGIIDPDEGERMKDVTPASETIANSVKKEMRQESQVIDHEPEDESQEPEEAEAYDDYEPESELLPPENAEPEKLYEVFGPNGSAFLKEITGKEAASMIQSQLNAMPAGDERQAFIRHNAEAIQDLNIATERA